MGYQPLSSGTLNFMKLIPLSKNGKYKGLYFAQVDDEDYEFLMKWEWFALKKNRNIYAARKDYSSGKIIKMHNAILTPQAGMVIDHIDRIGINNQKSNLRRCLQKNNCANKRSFGKTSNHNGVTFRDGYFYKKRDGSRAYCEMKKKWIAQIGAEGAKARHLGYFLTEKEAAIAYNIAASQMYGEFANLNVVD